MYLINQGFSAILAKNDDNLPPLFKPKNGFKNLPITAPNEPALNNPTTLKNILAQEPTPEEICQTSNNVNAAHNTVTPIIPTPV